MSNAVHKGFSTLNRFFGKKNKDAGTESKSLPKSTATLSRSTSNLDASSQYNKIVPLVAASTNAPFEQTFRITVCLPMDQLYVARVGARTKLVNLLNMVCTNKLLDQNKFEFRDPIDETQVFDLEMTIGEVGLNEIRLASKVPIRQTDGVKTRPHSTIITHHSQTLPKFQLTDHRLSSRTTASPYSSTNSLNSTDSSGMNSSLRSGSHHGPVAPSRKKRVAPRPPSQNSIPEDREHKCSPPSSQTDDGVFKRPLQRQNFHVSSPNLTNNNGAALRYTEFHCSNNNVCPNNEPANGETSISSIETNSSGGEGKKVARPLSTQTDVKNLNDYGRDEETLENHYAESMNSNHSRTSSETSDTTKDGNGPEPSPRKQIIVAKKKAPAPPPRTVITSTAAPVATPRNIPERIVEEQMKEDNPAEETKAIEKPEEKTATELPKSSPPVTPTKTNSSPNITKVMLNVDTTVLSHSQITAEISDKSAENVDTTGKSISNVSKTNITTSDSVKTSPTRNVSKTNLNGLTETEPLYQTVDITKKKTKSISVVDLNVEQQNIKNLEACPETNNGNGINHEDVSKVITHIINRAVEINESAALSKIDGNNNNVVQSKDWQPNQIEMNNTYCEDNESNPESPLWIYTLPAPPTFADNKIIKSNEANSNKEQPRNFVTSSPIEDKQKNSDHVPIENPIRPIIVEKQHLDFQDLSDNSLPHSLSTTDTLTTTGTNATDRDSLITSDIEDGYQGNENDRVAMKNIQNTRDQFIEDEFKFLKDHSEDKVADTNGHTDKHFNNGSHNEPEHVIVENGKQKILKNNPLDKMNNNVEQIPRKLSNPINNRKLSNEDVAKTDVIEELNNILSTNRLDTVIRKPDENDQIDTAKRSSLTNFQIGSYTNGNHEKVSTNQPNNTNGHHMETNGSQASTEVREVKTPGKRNSLTLNGMDKETNHDSALKTPTNIMRSKSFHSMQLTQEQSVNDQDNLMSSDARPFALAPRTSSYISLIGTQKFDNKPGKKVDNSKKVSRQRSISELSIADSPSLQSLEVMKTILSNSRKNSLVEQNGQKVVPNGNTVENGNKKSHQDEVDLRNSSIQYNNQSQSKPFESKVPENEIIMRHSEKPKDIGTKNDQKKWTYQGPPSINLSTWGDRPKSQVIIKSDNDYKFGGVSKVTALQKRFSAAIDENNLNSSSNNGYERNDAHENDSKSYKLPIVRGVEYKKNVALEQTNGNSKSNENSVELRQRPSYEVSCLVTEKPSSTMTLGRAPSSKPAIANQHSQVFANNNHNSLQRNISFNQFTNYNNKFTPVVKGFKAKDIMNGSHNGTHNGVDHDYLSNESRHQSTVPSNNSSNSRTSVVFTTYDQEKRHIEVERPSFSQFALKKTGLKEKIVDDTMTNGHGTNKGHTVVDGKPKMVNGNRNSVPVPPPKPVHQNGFLPQNQQSKPTNGGYSRNNSLAQQKNGDPMDQLLDSIRNFNRNGLKRC